MQALYQSPRPKAEGERVGLHFQPDGLVVVRGDRLGIPRQTQRIDRLDIVGRREERLEQIGRPQRKEMRLVRIDEGSDGACTPRTARMRISSSVV